MAAYRRRGYSSVKLKHILIPIMLIPVTVSSQHSVENEAVKQSNTIEISNASSTEAVGRIVDIVKSIVMILAVLVGGIWAWLLFIKTRQRYPRAETSHNIQSWTIADGDSLLHMTLNIKNIGEVLLSIEAIELRVQQVIPFDQELARNIVDGVDLIEENESEIEWPEIYSRKLVRQQGDLEIEPGEMDQIHFDAIIPKVAKTIEVYTHIKNEKKRRRDKSLGWPLTTLYSIQPVKE